MDTLLTPLTEHNNKSYHTLQLEFSEILSKYATSEGIDNINKDSLLNHPAFSDFLKFSPGILVIIDFKTQGYIYLSENLEQILGYKTDEFYRLGLAKTISMFPIDHSEIIIRKIFPIMLDFFDRHSELGNVHDIRVSFTTKVVKADGTKGWYLHQMQVLHVDEFNKPQLGFKLIFDITDIKKDETINIIVAEKTANGIFRNIYSQTFITNNRPFSKSRK